MILLINASILRGCNITFYLLITFIQIFENFKKLKEKGLEILKKSKPQNYRSLLQGAVVLSVGGKVIIFKHL